MGVGDFISEGWDGIKGGVEQGWDGIKSVPESLKSFNIMHLVIAIAITGFVTVLFFMPEMMGMKGWPVYIKIAVPCITLVASYIWVQVASEK